MGAEWLVSDDEQKEEEEEKVGEEKRRKRRSEGTGGQALNSAQGRREGPRALYRGVYSTIFHATPRH